MKDLRREHSFSKGSYYPWRRKFGGASVPQARWLRELEAENTRLKGLLGDSMLEIEVNRKALLTPARKSPTDTGGMAASA